MKILEEFWYGNIEPTDYDTSSCKEYKKLQELICQNDVRSHGRIKTINYFMLPVGLILRVAFCSGKTITELPFGKFLNCAFDNSRVVKSTM